MSRHLVAYTYSYHSFNDDGSLYHAGTVVISGFLLELDGLLFWVTAGHCLKELDEKINNKLVRIVDGGYLDYFGSEACHHHMYPFIYRPGEAFYVENPTTALDFALITLNGLQIRCFLENKNVPIGRANWEHQASLQFDFYYMLGIPADAVVTKTHAGEATCMAAPVLIAIDRLDSPVAHGALSNDWFAGKIAAGVTRTDIKGMSGGPIYGFRKIADGRLAYHVVALQSRWLPVSRIIFGCSLPLFAEELYQVVHAQQAEQQ